jgi:hypothetical protein
LFRSTLSQREPAGGASKRSRRLAIGTAAIAASLVAAGCAKPTVAPYPYVGPYGSMAGVTAEAQKRSNALEQYVKDFLDGKVSATIPNNLLPEGRPPELTTFTIQKPDQVDPNKQWGLRAAHPVNWNDSLGNYNDAKASYMVNHGMLAPFGSKVIIEGTFPKARYFSIQTTPAFKAENYRSGAYGAGEVSWLDADIDPNPGSTNPFRVGANRNATERSFKITCDSKIGDPAVTDASSFTAPNYRAVGNNRGCGGLVYKGPWGDPNWAEGDQRGQWAPGELWLRIYAADKSSDPYGGMKPPKVLYQLPDGRQYWIQTDLNGFMANINKTRAITAETPTDNGYGASGWTKQVSILRQIYSGLASAGIYGPMSEADKNAFVRSLDKSVAGRGSDLPGIASRDPHATGGVHIQYLGRLACVGDGKVFALTGKLPTTPKTRNGEPTMTAAQARYFSIMGYSLKVDVTPGFVAGAELTSIMDDEIVTNASGDYTIMYGRAKDRPANATAANGVTWVEWGPEACQELKIRWISAGPEWMMPQSPSNLSWAADGVNENYDPNLIGKNVRTGFFGVYQPVAVYETKAQFEAHGNGFNPLTLPPLS